jgi:hypothetical protein
MHLKTPHSKPKTFIYPPAKAPLSPYQSFWNPKPFLEKVLAVGDTKKPSETPKLSSFNDADDLLDLLIVGGLGGDTFFDGVEGVHNRGMISAEDTTDSGEGAVGELFDHVN